MLHFGRSDYWSRDPFAEEPSESNLRYGYSLLFCNLLGALAHVEIFGSEESSAKYLSDRYLAVSAFPPRLYLPVRKPRAKGLHGIRAIPWSLQNGIISRSSSR